MVEIVQKISQALTQLPPQTLSHLGVLLVPLLQCVLHKLPQDMSGHLKGLAKGSWAGLSQIL